MKGPVKRLNGCESRATSKWVRQVDRRVHVVDRDRSTWVWVGPPSDDVVVGWQVRTEAVELSTDTTLERVHDLDHFAARRLVLLVGGLRVLLLLLLYGVLTGVIVGEKVVRYLGIAAVVVIWGSSTCAFFDACDDATGSLVTRFAVFFVLPWPFQGASYRVLDMLRAQAK